MDNPNPVATSLEDYYAALNKRHEDYNNSSVKSNTLLDITTLNQQRNKLVNQVLTASNAHKNILLEFATGTGKSNCAIQIIKKHYKTPPNILILVAETTHKNNWIKEFEKFEAKEYLEQCTIECYQSAHKFVNNKYDVIVADEAHHLLETELRLQIASNLKAERRIFLSATLKYTQKCVLQQLYNTYTLKVNLSKAVEKNLLPKFKMVALTLELDDVKRKHVVIVNKSKIKKQKGENTNEKTDKLKTVDFKDRFLPSYKGTPYKMHLTDKEYYAYLFSIAEMFKKKTNGNPAGFMDIYLKKRNEIKKFLGNQKTEYAKQLSQKLHNNNQRFICYCASINQANELSTNSTIHSKKSEKENNTIIESFQNGKINSLYAIAKLIEGTNLDNIDAGIIIQTDNTERLFVQKSGRVMRSIAPICYILYFKNTIDVDYVTKSLSGINDDFKVKYNFNEFIKWQNNKIKI